MGSKYTDSHPASSVSVLKSTPLTGFSGNGFSGGLAGGLEFFREARRGEGGGLLGGGVVRKAAERRGEVVFRIEAVGAAVGQKRVDEGVVGPSFEAAVEEPVLRAEFGRADAVFDVVVVEGKTAVLKATPELGPFSQGVVEGLPEREARQVAGSHRNHFAVELVGDGADGGTADEFAAGGVLLGVCD